MYKKLLEIIPQENILVDEPMKNHTSFKTGGNADYIVCAKNAEEIIKIISLCKNENIPFFIMGNYHDFFHHAKLQYLRHHYDY